MTTQSNTKTRYSDFELEEFKAVIETKLAKAREQLDDLQEQMMEMTDNNSDEHGGDWIDDSSYNSTMEMLNTMAIRQRMHIRDLENALVRIRNKTYGVCVISGELIDKKRLMAVPTTTKSLLSKNIEQQKINEKMLGKPTIQPYIKTDSPKIFSRIISKSNPKAAQNKQEDFSELEDDFEDDFDDNLDVEDDNDINLDELPDEDSSSEYDL